MAFYNYTKRTFLDATLESEAPVDLINDDVRAMLMDATDYSSPNIDTESHYNDLPANAELAAAGGYSKYGGALANPVTAVDNSNDRATFSADDLTFTAVTGTQTFGSIVIMRQPDSGAADTNRLLVAYLDVQDTTTNGGNITINWDSNGILFLA